MEMMPYQPLLEPVSLDGVARGRASYGASGDAPDAPKSSVCAPPIAATSLAEATWQAGLPVLQGLRLTLRELRLTDAPALLALLTTKEVARFISPPPTTIAQFEGFIAWTLAKRRAGTYACFAVVPEGHDSAVGIFQVRALTADFASAEWGFALGAPYWGQGQFLDGALQVLRFAFETLGVRRLEARACVENGRGNSALRKLGAVRECVLRQSFRKDGRAHDQALWTLLRDHGWCSPGEGGTIH